MKRQIDLGALLAPISEEKAGGEDLRYSQEYDEIKEARRSDDPLDQGEWKTEIKKADWNKVISLSVNALTGRTKDLQIAVWLTEALIVTEGFEGCLVGLRVINGLIADFWDCLYPAVEEGDLEYRMAPLEFLGEKVGPSLADVPITERAKAQAFSLAQWQESRKVGYESDTRDEEKLKRREEYLAEGKANPEEVDSAIAASSPAFYEDLAEDLVGCKEEFATLDRLVDERFGQDAPRISDFGKVIDEAAEIVEKICRQKGLVPAQRASAEAEDQVIPVDEVGYPAEATLPSPVPTAPLMQADAISLSRSALVDAGPWEQALWEEALHTLKTAGAKKALERLAEASLTAPSPREQNRWRLLMARLCLEAHKPELALPVLEQLYTLIEELHLDRWESPVWIAEVIGSYYQCLTSGESSDDDIGRAQELFRRLCTLDVTKAIAFRT
jgi:type VI secretion system protein ImpA